MRGQCPCGEPAICSDSASLVCATCLQIEQAYAAKQKKTGQKHAPGRGGFTHLSWPTYHHDAAPICGASLEHLAALLGE